jgi:hypothetical protein
MSQYVKGYVIASFKRCNFIFLEEGELDSSVVFEIDETDSNLLAKALEESENWEDDDIYSFNWGVVFNKMLSRRKVSPPTVREMLSGYRDFIDVMEGVAEIRERLVGHLFRSIQSIVTTCEPHLPDDVFEKVRVAMLRMLDVPSEDGLPATVGVGGAELEKSGDKCLVCVDKNLCSEYQERLRRN